MTGKHLKAGVISHFFIALVLDGLHRLTGLFMLELLKSVNLNRQNAVLPFTASWAVANIVASFSGILIPSKKSKSIILLGVLLTAIGAALCILTTNITTLTVFWGFIFGSGYGLSSPHLSRYLKTVNPSSSFLQATPNLGAAIMPFVFHILVSYYGLQSSYLIFSGIILNYLPLSLAAAYSIELPIPNIKWRVRKRSSHYLVSKQDGCKTIFNESFINSLEPDMILTISQSERFQNDIKTDLRGSEDILKEMIHVNRKRSETRGNDLQSLPTNMRILSPHRTHSQIITDIENYEKGMRVFEGSFSNSNAVYEDDESMEDNKPKEQQGENNGDQICHIIHFEKDLETNDTDTKTEEVIERNHSIDLKQDTHTSEETTECETKRRLSKDHESVNVCSGKDTEKYLSAEMQTNESLQSVVENKGEDQIAIEVEYKAKDLERQNDNEISLSKEHSEKSSPPINFPISENLKLMSKLDNKTVIQIPLDIKVHVVECFMTDDEYWKAKNEHAKGKKNSYREHSNSMLPGMYDNIDFTQLKRSKATKNSAKLESAKLSNIYTISEHTEFDRRNKASLKRKEKSENYTMSKIKPVFKFLNEITSPICLCIILITIIFEFNIVTLITIFADFGNDIDDNCLDFKYILVSFGVGGLIGKICCCKISRTIPEKSHTIGVILFLLTGLSTAGALFSPNLYWFAGFYCILGALEGGITYTIPKVILEHIDKNLHLKLSSVKNFLSGIAITSIPYVISLSRDGLDDYEFLLQILSCSSVFCAFLAYFLPHLSKTFK